MLVSSPFSVERQGKELTISLAPRCKSRLKQDNLHVIVIIIIIVSYHSHSLIHVTVTEDD